MSKPQSKQQLIDGWRSAQLLWLYVGLMSSTSLIVHSDNAAGTVLNSALLIIGLLVQWSAASQIDRIHSQDGTAHTNQQENHDT